MYRVCRKIGAARLVNFFRKSGGCALRLSVFLLSNKMTFGLGI